MVNQELVTDPTYEKHVSSEEEFHVEASFIVNFKDFRSGLN